MGQEEVIVIKDSLRIYLEKDSDDASMLTMNLKGFLDTYNSADFQREVNKVIESGFIKILFNCSELNYVSSTGIGAFTAFLKTLKQKNGDLVLLYLQPKVFEVFQLLGFSKFFNISSNLEEARKSLSGKKEEISKSVFPKIFKCPICKKNLKAVKSGRFRCSECKTILNVDEEGRVYFG
ncbi:MAG TPA: STAS domain-containing protein [Spirochaetota bacterium]|jgi:anti-anti-sigma factor|nr:MAG: putative anti-sigma factor antagonist BtrV [Spirochaetes bacterium ADurb.Bin133]HNZ27916.1 STAS domain-containing protein [Spirochaetota bacterium]HOF01563.1 STAS domain-containing protein [Spirochaetota bacterium]HOS33600.1 STAS domain-containing protein [Spirochaetota bacterium]HOS55567.1 STAS domain-containing protein [Spirochaetota bacterium]